MMDHVAAELGLDPLDVRQKNLMPDGSTRHISKQVIQLRSRIPAKGEAGQPWEQGLIYVS